MTKEELEKLGLTPEQTAEITNKIAALTQERDNVVGELKEDRQKRQQMTDEIELLKTALADATTKNTTNPPAGDDVTKLVETLLDKKLGEQKASIAKGNKVAAIERFVRENPAFNEQNDSTGKLREALENKLNAFNTNGLETVEQFYSVVVDAARLLGAHTTPTNPDDSSSINAYAHMSPQSAVPKTTTQNGLSEKESRLVKQNGWTVEKYIKLREKMPDTIADLLARVN